MKRGANRWTRWLAIVATPLGIGGCGAHEDADGSPRLASSRMGSSAIQESPAVEARVEAIRGRFLVRVAPPVAPSWPSGQTTAPAVPRPALGAGVASGFEVRDGHVHAVIPEEARRRVARTASVALPLRAGDPVELEDDTSHVALGFALRGASDAEVGTSGGVALYANALAGADALHRVHAEGTEDYLVFQERPTAEEIAYEVDVSRAAGLRLVSNTLEFLDEGGDPRLRVAPPHVVDAQGARTEGALSVEGCAFDASPRAPWGRAVTPPGASRCAVRVAWRAAAYPAMVDPNWTATGSMATAREQHTATVAGLTLLVAGGWNGQTLSSAELYDAASGTFAATGAMLWARGSHTATAFSPFGGEMEVLVTGGDNEGTTLQTAELYQPADGTFQSAGCIMTSPREQHTATLLESGKVLLAGGYWAGAGLLRTADLYDPYVIPPACILPTGAMAEARYEHAATLLSGSVLVTGGSGTTTAELYDPAAEAFATTAGPMAQPRYLHTATLLPSSGKVLLAGGVAGSALSTAELYDPTGGTFAATGSMTVQRQSHTATVLDSREVLIAGGTPGQLAPALSSAELYDPTAGTFAATASMSMPRSFHAATLLDSGQVLVTGGDNVTGQQSSAELFACTTACPAGADCGTIPDGCGGTLSCGPACTAPQTCGGAGTANVCGCTPITSCPGGQNCGTIPDGCGGTLSCGPACTAPQTCGGAGTANVCGCTPMAICPAGDDCGTVPDGCGGALVCGDCGANQICSENMCVASGSSSSSSSSSGATTSGTTSSGSGPGGAGGETSSGQVGTAGSGTSVTLGRQGGCGCKTAGDPRESSGTSLSAFSALALAGAVWARSRSSTKWPRASAQEPAPGERDARGEPGPARRRPGLRRALRPDVPPRREGARR